MIIRYEYSNIHEKNLKNYSHNFYWYVFVGGEIYGDF